MLAAHQERTQSAREEPGLAGILLKLAEDPKYGGPVTISKPDFGRELADRMLREYYDARADDPALQALLSNRPLLAFVLDRVLPVLMGPRWR